MKKKNEYNYFDVLIAMSENIVKSANILNECLKEYNHEMINENIVRLHSFETDCDRMAHEFSNQMVKDFITPFDREDLDAIIHKLDDVEDNIDELLIDFKILNVTSIRSDINEFTILVINAANAVKEMFLSFKNFKKYEIVKAKVIEINEIEDKADRKYEKLMTNLYSTETNPIEIIKWNTIYTGFENTIDSCERLGEVVSLAALKNV